MPLIPPSKLTKLHGNRAVVDLAPFPLFGFSIYKGDLSNP